MAQSLSQDEMLALVDRLADGEWQSGEALAASFGISRAALAKRVERLKDWQLLIEARQGLGYRLTTPIERLDRDALQTALGKALRVDVQAVLDSTSSRIVELPAQADPQALLAEFQTAGRGRRGRQWLTPFGSQLALSLAWSFDTMPRQLTTLPLAVGVACARVIRSCGIADVGLKWPNDILVDGHKLGGILLEHRGESGSACRVIVGIGINVSLHVEQAAAVDQPWASLNALLAARELPAVSRNALAARLLRELVDLLSTFELGGFAPLLGEWNALDLSRGRGVCVTQNEQTFEAIACGVDADGALLVEVNGRRQALHSGEVRLRMLP
jgi:BirA family biotin operon repressor/biotin-[acetyl-CoA-carboxylase] ligase